MFEVVSDELRADYLKKLRVKMFFEVLTGRKIKANHYSGLKTPGVSLVLQDVI